MTENFRPGHTCYVPGENLAITVRRRENAYVHKVSEGAGGGGLTVLAGDELECARFLFPEIDGYAERMQHAQAMAELAAAREAVESALLLLDRREREVAEREAAA